MWWLQGVCCCRSWTRCMSISILISHVSLGVTFCVDLRGRGERRNHRFFISDWSRSQSCGTSLTNDQLPVPSLRAPLVPVTGRQTDGRTLPRTLFHYFPHALSHCIANLVLFHTCYSSANLLFTRSYLPDRRHCEMHKLLYLWSHYQSPDKVALSPLKLPEDSLRVPANKPKFD